MLQSREALPFGRGIASHGPRPAQARVAPRSAPRCSSTPDRRCSSTPDRTAASSFECEDCEPPPVPLCDHLNKYQRAAAHDFSLPSVWDLPDLPHHHTSRRGITNKVQLSTYADCIGSNLADLMTFLQTEVRDAIGSIHLLPIYPSTGDRGFAPVSYTEVDPAFGGWTDVRMLAAQYQLCLEYMVNHISPGSEQYQDYLQHGEQSKFAPMFVKWHDIWGKEGPDADQLAKVRTRKPEPPLLVAHLADGTQVPLWCTFGSQQIDINPMSEEGWAFTEQSIKSLIEQGGCRLIRLDAFGYVTKKAGTDCFMQEPGVWDLLYKIKELVRPYGVQLLCEVHEDFKLNIELARHGFWVYDFALPLLVIHAMKYKTAESLRYWMSICPRRQITTLDTHDGMGVDDIAGLAPLCSVPELQQSILDIGGNINYKHLYKTTGGADKEHHGDGAFICPELREAAPYVQRDVLQGSYVSEPHQLNASYFSALHEDPKKYLCARALQFFTPGVPMVYYNGLLAGVNDYELCEQGSIRDINRHYYTLDEARDKAQQPHVQALLRLCRFRNAHPAFKGRIYVDDACPSHLLHVRWYYGNHHVAELRADMSTCDFAIRHTPYDPAGAAEMVSPYSVDMASIFSVDAMDLDTRAATRADATIARSTIGATTTASDGSSAGSAGGSASASASASGNGNGNGAMPPGEDGGPLVDDSRIEWQELDLSHGWSGSSRRQVVRSR